MKSATNSAPCTTSIPRVALSAGSCASSVVSAVRSVALDGGRIGCPCVVSPSREITFICLCTRRASSLHDAARRRRPGSQPAPPFCKRRNSKERIQKCEAIWQHDASQVERPIQFDPKFTQRKSQASAQQKVRQQDGQPIEWCLAQFRLGASRGHRAQGNMLKPTIATFLAQRP